MSCILIDKTARRLAEQELRESEERYRLLVETSLDAVLLATPDGQILSANPAACRMFGYSEEELMRIGRKGVVDAADPRLPAALEERARTGRFHGEVTLVRSDGTKFPGEISSAVFRIGEGQLRTSMVIRDVSERKRAKEIIRSLAKFPSENPNPVLRIAREGTLLYANEAGLRLLPEWQLQVGQAAYSTLQGAALRSLDNRSNQVLEFEHRGRVYSFFVAPIMDASYANLYGRDITDVKRAEEALRMDAQRLQILHEIDQGILAAQSPEAVAQAALKKLAQLVPCQRASLCVFDLKLREATVLAVWSAVKTGVGTGRHFALDEFAEELRQGKVVVVANIQEVTPMGGQVYQALQAEGIRSFVHLPLIARGELIGSLNLGANVPSAFSPPHLEIAREVADALALGLENVHLLQQVRKQHQGLKAVTARLVEAEESERRRLARELHDRVGQDLTMLSIGLDTVRSLVPSEAATAVQARLVDCQRLLAETAERIRDVMAELRPPLLDDYGLLAALRWYGRQFAGRTGLKVNVQGEEPAPRLASAKETALFRITQEALNNVAKHAQARQVTLHLDVAAERVWLTVTDDGAGFQPQGSLPVEGPAHWGLLTMREQAEAVGGSLEVESAPGQGTRLTAEVARSGGTAK